MKQKGLFAATPQVDEHEFNVQLSFYLFGDERAQVKTL